jgi:hypothetical protein
VSRRVSLDQQSAFDAVVSGVAGEVGGAPTSSRTTAKYFTAKWKRDGGVITARVAPIENEKCTVALVMSVASDTELPAAKALLTSWLPDA